jgi:hypothetical protein
VVARVRALSAMVVGGLVGGFAAGFVTTLCLTLSQDRFNCVMEGGGWLNERALVSTLIGLGSGRE